MDPSLDPILVQPLEKPLMTLMIRMPKGKKGGYAVNLFGPMGREIGKQTMNLAGNLHVCFKLFEVDFFDNMIVWKILQVMFLQVCMPVSEAWWQGIDHQDSVQGHQEGQGFRQLHLRHSASFIEQVFFLR